MALFAGPEKKETAKDLFCAADEKIVWRCFFFLRGVVSFCHAQHSDIELLIERIIEKWVEDQQLTNPRRSTCCWT